MTQVSPSTAGRTAADAPMSEPVPTPTLGATPAAPGQSVQPSPVLSRDAGQLARAQRETAVAGASFPLGPGGTSMQAEQEVEDAIRDNLGSIGICDSRSQNSAVGIVKTMLVNEARQGGIRTGTPGVFGLPEHINPTVPGVPLGGTGATNANWQRFLRLPAAQRREIIRGFLIRNQTNIVNRMPKPSGPSGPSSCPPGVPVTVPVPRLVGKKFPDNGSRRVALAVVAAVTAAGSKVKGVLPSPGKVAAAIEIGCLALIGAVFMGFGVRSVGAGAPASAAVSRQVPEA